METQEVTPRVKDGTPTLAKQDEMALRDWFSEMSSKATVQIKVYRDAPKTWRGKNVGGFLWQTSDTFDEEELRSRHGGGKYKITAFRQNEQGKWVHYSQRTIEIGGDPKISGEIFEDGGNGETTVKAADAEDASLVRKALDMTERRALDDSSRARELERELRDRSSFDPNLIAMLTKPLEMQVGEMSRSLGDLRTELRSKDDKILELTTRRDSPTDKILEKMIDGESARILAIREQHDAELRTTRSQHQDDLKRQQDYFMEDSRRRDAGHEREVKTIQDSYQNQIRNLEVSYGNRIEILNGQIKALERDLDATKKELAELRGKKDTPIEEQFTRLVQLKEMFESLGGAEEGDTSIVGKVAETLAPVLEGIGQRLARSGGAVEGSQEPHVPTQAQPRPRPQPRAQPKAPPALPSPSDFGLEMSDIKSALQFAEGAARNETDPQAFAQSARNMIPSGIIMFIRTNGIDALLGLAPPEEGSYLSTQAGRTWLRKVGKVITEPDPT